MESRLVPSATVQFSVGAETINENAGTFSIPVTLTGAVAPTTSNFASGFSSPDAEAFDGAGNLYVANGFNGTVSKVTPTGAVSPFATGFSLPEGLAFDAAGNLYVGDLGTNGRVSKVTPAGAVSTFASTYAPNGLAFDAAGNLYVANQNNNTVSKVTSAGVVSTFASGFSNPNGLAFDAAGNLYVANYSNNTVSKVTPGGTVSTFTSAISVPNSLAFDAAGNLYVGNGKTVSEVTPTGVVSTFATATNSALAFDAAGNLYVANDTMFNAVDKVSETVTVPFTLGGTAVSGVDYSGVTAGSLTFGIGQTTKIITGTIINHPGANKTLTFTLGTPSNNAALGSPSANTVTIDESNLSPTLTSIAPTFVKVGDPNTTITLTGSNFVFSDTADFNGTPLTTTVVSSNTLTAVIPAADLTTATVDLITVAAAGPGGATSAPQTFTVNNPAPILASISPTSAIVGDPNTTITLNGTGFVNGSTAEFNGAALVTTFVSANKLTTVIPASDLATVGMDLIAVVTSAPGGGMSAAQTFTVNNPPPTLQFTTGSETVNERAGTFSIPVTLTGFLPFPTITSFGSGFLAPSQIAFDAAGNLFVADSNVVKEVTPAGGVSTFASGFSDLTGLAFHAGNLYVANGGLGIVNEVTPGGVVSIFATGFTQPEHIAFDAAGNLYVANLGANTVSKVTPTGAISIFAGGFNQPWGLAFDAGGNLYVANGDAVSKVTPAGVVTTFASGIIEATGLTFDAAGNLYVIAAFNQMVDEVTPAGVVSIVASGFHTPVDVAFDAAGNLYVSNEANGTVSELSTTVTVSYSVGGTAVSGTDYSGVSAGSLTFGIGLTTQYITGVLIDDGSPDASKTITFTLSAPSSNAVLGSPTVNTLTIGEVNPAPTLTSINSPAVVVGSSNTTVTLTGSNFVNGSTADFNGMGIVTTFISTTELTAVIPTADLTIAGTDAITVVTPTPGGGTSASQTFTVQTADERFLSHVYLDLLHRAIDSSGLAYWESVLNAPGASRVNVVLSIEQSQEYYALEVQAVYLQYLHRAADAGGLAGSVNFLAAGNTVEQLIVAIVTDPGREFINGQGSGPFQSFLSAFYQDALGRPIDAGGQQFFANSTPAAAAAAILSSTEYHTGLVTQDYAFLLDRRADSGDQVWITGLNMGIREETVIADIAGGNEYYGKTTP